MSEPLVLVTGASGFVASHVTRQLQEDGYKVRVTVRDAKNEKKLKPLHNLCPTAKFPIEIVEADLLAADSWHKAVEGCTFVMHVASPFPLSNPKTADELIRPAMEGTLNVLRASAASKTVKRVVLTSSIVTISASGVKEEGHIFNEDDFLSEDDIKQNFYGRSKIAAEAAAWKFVEELPEGEKFELSVINPGMIIGPVLHGAVGSSMDLIKQILERKYPVAISVNVLVCDVRDVATAHVKCMTLPEANGKRHIIGSVNKWLKEIAEILHKEFQPQGYSPATTLLPGFLTSIAMQFNGEMKVGVKYYGKELKSDNSRMKDVLQINPVPAEKSIIDAAYSLIETGFVKKTNKYRGNNAT